MYSPKKQNKEKEYTNKFDFKLMRRLITYIIPYKKLVILSTIFMIISASMNLLYPYILKIAIDKYLAKQYYIYSDTPTKCQQLIKKYQNKNNNIIKIETNTILISKSTIEKLSKPTRKQIQQSLYTIIQNAKIRLPQIIKQKQITNNPQITLINNKYINSLNPKQKQTLKKYHPHKNFYVFQKQKKLNNTGYQLNNYWLVPANKLNKIPLKTLLNLHKNQLIHIKQLFLIMLAIIIINLITSYGQIVTLSIAGQKAMYDLRTKLFKHIQTLSLNFFNKNPIGKLVTRVTNDVEALNEMFASVLVTILRDILMLIGAIAILFSFSIKLALIALCIIPIFAIISFVFKQKVRKVYRQSRKHLSSLNAHLAEDLSGIKIIQIFQREKTRQKKYTETNNKYFSANFKQMIIFGIFRPLIELVATTTIALILIYGGISVISGTITIGALVAFTNYIRKMFQPLSALSEKYTIIQSAMAAAERTFQILDEKPQITENNKAQNIPIRGNVKFQNVSFSYTPEKQILNNISFQVEAGKSVAIVGPTGAGKSSIINLLCRFYDVDNGSITIDNQDIRNLPFKTLRDNISIVLQDAFIFSRTINENISMSDKLTQEQINEAAKIVQINQFINTLPHNYTQIMSEGGATLSTGQKQLICFARALAHNPKILILDEATSSIDPNTESLIQQAIEQLMKNRTCIIVAHRLSTIQKADQILVIDQGQILERGTHQQLLAKKGIYYNLFLLQYQNN